MSQVCSIEGCSRPFLARGWCSTHYYRWSKHGHPERLVNDMTGTGYQSIHSKLKSTRGVASEYACVVCGLPAHHWAWQHRGPRRVATVSGRQIEWGVDLEDYEPMCYRCHAIMDAGGSFETFACGHPRDHRKDCRVCRNERQNAARRQKRKQALGK